ncbi:MAG: TIGR04255 family protein [Candidatus Omnitrophica bacterium]|nr:TIGR04255 family protein [Candidatus Omnitrophota bacterium]
MARQNLKNKPLVEALLEIKWKLPEKKEDSLEGDPHYRILLGRLSERLRDKYPFYQSLPSANIPDAMVPHVVQHRFRVEKDSWPLVQLGPGILTVNETEGYTWDEFKPRCEAAVNLLYESHPQKEDFSVEEITLRYIDAVEVNFGQTSVLDVLREKLKTTISLPESLFDNSGVVKSPSAFAWQASFDLEKSAGTITLRFSKGERHNKPALIWETLVQCCVAGIPKIPEGFSDWLENSHTLTSSWFFKLIEGDLERRFSGE